MQTIDFGTSEHRSATRRYITKYRLECSDRRAGNLCYPKKPITYYVDRDTPEWLKKYVRAGIVEWQPAFEAAGFKDGIVAADPPSPQQDPDWSPEDIRHTMIRWLPSHDRERRRSARRTIRAPARSSTAPCGCSTTS